MEVRINGKLKDFDNAEDLQDAIDCALDDEREKAYDDGFNDGKDIGFDEAVESVDIPEITPRETDYRHQLYRAIYAGDLDGAEDIANMMAMVDIDRDLIERARGEVRNATK